MFLCLILIKNHESRRYLNEVLLKRERNFEREILVESYHERKRKQKHIVGDEVVLSLNKVCIDGKQEGLIIYDTAESVVLLLISPQS